MIVEPSPFSERADLGFAWSVKDSFLQYVRGMRDGNVAWGAGAAVTSEGEFHFPLLAARRFADATMWSFGGNVQFTAHHGLLSVSIGEPRIALRDGEADLLIHAGDAVKRIAVIDLPPRIQDGDVTMWLRCGVTLVDHGAELFGGIYPAGESLAPLTLRVPRGGAAEIPSAPRLGQN